MTPRHAVAQPIPRERRHELVRMARGAANVPSHRGTSSRTSPCPLHLKDTPNAAEQIYSMLRDEIAVPALRRFERAHRVGAPRTDAPAHAAHLAHAARQPARAQTMAGTPAWFNDLLPHLRIEAQLLAQRGLDVDTVRQRFDALVRHEHPGVSWRAMRIGLERDALPFALGAAALSTLADTTDPARRWSMMWPPVEALGVVLINLIGMARFQAMHPAWASRLAPLTPTQALESVNTMLRNPVRDIAAHVAGFVFCYGVVRNLARVGLEAGLSAALPGIMAHRFGSTIHACLEILLCPIPGAFLGPMVDRIAIAPENARLEPLLQDRFADLISKMSDDMPREPPPPFRRAFLTHFTGLLQSGAPKAIWLTLSLGFYFLSTFHGAATRLDGGEGGEGGEGEPDLTIGVPGNTTTPASEFAPGVSTAVDWHTQAVLSVLYGLIATFVSMQGISTRHDAIATAYTRRRGRPKISTATVTSQGDSGLSSAGSHTDMPDSPDSPDSPSRLDRNTYPLADGRMRSSKVSGEMLGERPEDASGDTFAQTCGDTSGDDSVFLPMDDTDSASGASDTGNEIDRTRPADAPQGRKKGTFVAPSGICRQASPQAREDASDADVEQTPL